MPPGGKCVEEVSALGYTVFRDEEKKPSSLTTYRSIRWLSGSLENIRAKRYERGNNGKAELTKTRRRQIRDSWKVRWGNTFGTPGRWRAESGALSPGASRAYCMISSDAFLPRDPAWGRSRHLQVPARRRERVERISVRGGKRKRTTAITGPGCALCVHTFPGPVRRQIGTYNHRDYLVLGIDYGFA